LAALRTLFRLALDATAFDERGIINIFLIGNLELNLISQKIRFLIFNFLDFDDYFILSNLITNGLLALLTVPFLRRERLRLVVFLVRMCLLNDF